MASSIISLKPSMKKRLDFDHELMDEVGYYKLSKEQTQPIIERYLESRSPDDAYILGMSYLWVVKDLVCRYRAHWPQVLYMTDDLVSVGMSALFEFVDGYKEEPKERIFYSKMLRQVEGRLRDYINDNRSAFGASRESNARRERTDKPLEYNYARELHEEITGGDIDDPYFVDILDAIESLNTVDAEEMRELVLKFLDQNHHISEDELTPEEQVALEKLTDLVRNAGL